MTAPTATQASTPLGQYLTAAGGSFHPALHPRQDAYGTSIYTSEPLEPGTSVVRCPFSITITPTFVRTSIPTDLLPMPPSRVDLEHATDVDDDHVLMTLYLVLHFVNIHASELLAAFTRENRLWLAHEPYVAALPKPDSLRTPLYFTARERGLLRGTNLEGATRDREQGWKSEWQAVQVRMKGAGVDTALVEEVSWDRWLWASTMISSRAFPSSLIDGDKAHSTPALFPGVDLLNHRPTARVTWSTDKSMSLEAAAAARPAGVQDVGGLSIVVDEPVSAGSQVYNTYGAKSNEELLLGYGFVLPDSTNPADILALKLSLPPSEVAPELPALLKQVGMEQLRHTVPPSGEIPSALLAQMRLLVAFSSTPPPTTPGEPIGDDEEESGDDFAAVVERIRAAKDSEEAAAVLDFISWENELDVLDALGGMLEQKAQALMSVELDVEAGGNDGEDDIRPDVREMIRVYRSGQIAIVQAALAHRERLFEATFARAQEAGVDFAFEDEMNDDDDDGSDSE